MAAKKTRRTFSPEEKARIVLEMLDGGRKPSEIAEEYNIHPSLLHEWKKEFLENAAAVFVRRRPDITEKAQAKRIEELEETLRRKDEVIAIIAEENMAIKKNFSGRK